MCIFVKVVKNNMQMYLNHVLFVQQTLRTINLDAADRTELHILILYV